MVAALVNGKDHGGLAETMDKLNTKLGYGLSPWALLTAPPAAWAAARYLKALSVFRNLPGAFAVMSNFLESRAFLADALLGGQAGDAIRAMKMPLAVGMTMAVGAKVDKTRTGFADLGGLGDSGVAKWGGRLFGGGAIFSDGLTMWQPGGHSTGENVANRVAAGANAAGTGAVMAGESGAATVAKIAGIDASTGWIPVAGQAVMLGTGLYLAGDWAYNHVKPFHTS